MKCKYLFVATLLGLGLSAFPLYSQTINVVSTSPTGPASLSTMVADFTFTAESCTFSPPCPSATCCVPMCNTLFFILYGDGHYDSGIGNSIPRTHKYPTASTTYVTKAWFAKKKDVDPPSFVFKPVTTGIGGTYTNPPTMMNDKNVKIGTSWAPVAGDPHFVVLTIANTCNSWPDGTLEYFYHDSKLEVNAADFANFNNSGSLSFSSLPLVPPSTTYNRKCVLNYTGLAPGTQQHFFIPVTVELIGPEVLIDYKAVIKPAKLPCNSPSSNIIEISKTTELSAHDPNRKTVNIENICSNSAATSLEYRIKFQNDGEYFAGTVVVTDQLDPNLVDPLSVEVTSSSHGSCIPCIYAPDPANSNIATFTFAGIQLPGSNQIVPDKYDFDETIAEFTFTVNTLPNLPAGVIPNIAEVIFYPDKSTLQTNIANVYIGENSDNNPDCEEIERSQDNLKSAVPAQIIAVPNPFSSNLKLIAQVLPNEFAVVEILALSGNFMAQQTFFDSSEWDLQTENWPAGIYFVRIQTAHNVTIQRVVKQ